MRVSIGRGFERAARWMLAVGAMAALALPAAGCGGDKEARMPATTPPVNQASVRDFTLAELDSLRRSKERLGVTRDEYWDDRGGVLANEWFEVWYPPGKLTVSHGMYVLDHMMASRAEIASVFGRAPDEKLLVVCAQTMDAYTDATGRQWWNYSRIDAHRITFQPVPVMVARGIIDIAVPREYYEWAIRRLTNNRLPRWIEEGFPSELSGEWTLLQDNLTEFPNEPVKISIDEIEKSLQKDDDKMRSRIAYYNAYRMVHRLIKERGRAKLVAFALAVGDGKSTEDASQGVYGIPYTELIAQAQQWELRPLAEAPDDR
jgi:hypothetical protein